MTIQVDTPDGGVANFPDDTHKSRMSDGCPMSALPPKADITAAQTNVRYVPKADILRCSKSC
jgi:hypothetical protein